jgi:phosphatidylserine decarboxylase
MAREGLLFFLPFMVLSILFFYIFKSHPDMLYVYLGSGFFCFGCLIILFFRDPERRIPQGNDIIVSPADGRVVEIRKDRQQVIISIFMSIFSVHINRAPVSGVVERVEYQPGKFLAAFKDRASQLNERFEIEIKTNKDNVILHQIAGFVARRVVCRLKKGQEVQAGDRFGMIRFGSRVDLFLPSSVEIEIEKGQRVKGGQTLLGRIV